MDETTRPLTPEERRILERLRASKPQGGGAGFGALLAFLVTTGVLLIVSPSAWQVGWRSLLPAAAGLLAAGIVFRRLRRSRWHTEWLARLDRDLSAGVASVATARVTDALRVQEAEDEGSSYYLKLEDGRVLFLSGQYLYDAEDERRFPNTRVTVVRAPASRIVFDLTCDGGPLAPRATRAPFTAEEHDQGMVPEDGALLDVDFGSLVARAGAEA